MKRFGLKVVSTAYGIYQSWEAAVLHTITAWSKGHILNLHTLFVLLTSPLCALSNNTNRRFTVHHCLFA